MCGIKEKNFLKKKYSKLIIVSALLQCNVPIALFSID